MSAERVAEAHYRRQAALARRAAQRIGKLWRQVDRGNITPSWRALLAEAYAVLSGAQAIAAASAGGYVDAALQAQGGGADAAARVAPGRFAGVASDGRDLPGLLYRPAVRTLELIGTGVTPARALAAGAVSLDMIVRTQVADAGRVADGVAITARPEVAGYVRMVVGKTCARCLILAGRRYRWNEGFKRHPRCDCRHIPAAENAAGDLATNPRLAFADMDRAEQDRVFTKAGAQAIRDGADISQVVNARRGMETASVFGREVLVTTEGTTTRGLAGTRLGAKSDGRKKEGARYRSAVRVRLMPEQIYREAKGDRAEAVRLLRLHGFLI